MTDWLREPKRAPCPPACAPCTAAAAPPESRTKAAVRRRLPHILGPSHSPVQTAQVSNVDFRWACPELPCAPCPSACAPCRTLDSVRPRRSRQLSCSLALGISFAKHKSGVTQPAQCLQRSELQQRDGRPVRTIPSSLCSLQKRGGQPLKLYRAFFSQPTVSHSSTTGQQASYAHQSRQNQHVQWALQ